ncbi:hypothetical protein HNQ99_002911 [Rhizorhapis suberifaciens]|uniref:Uncharacterized protein n=1 Tax=Rhizorhapis suberifaciens TaxID=13656 RepID=A0A840HWW5_9SPHN|nr:hypothetical protein [Rhizorhapis suberifaciens]
MSEFRFDAGYCTDVLDGVALGADVIALGAAGVPVATAPTIGGGITAGGVAAGARLFSAGTSLVSAGLKLYDGNYRGAAASGIGALVGGGAEAGTRILLKLNGATDRFAGVAAEGYGLATSYGTESGVCGVR